MESNILEDISLFHMRNNSPTIEDLCRVCAREAVSLIPLFQGEGYTHALLEKIHRCLPIKVSTTDGLPTGICDECSAKLQICDELIITSIAAEEKLRIMQSERSEDETSESTLKLAHENLIMEVENSKNNFTEYNNVEVSSLGNQIDSSVYNPVFGDKTKREWSCDSCDYKATRKATLMVHKQRQHSATNFSEKHKQEVAKKGSNSGVIKQKKLCCEFCDKTFHSSARLKKHVLSHTRFDKQHEQEDTVSVCTECSEEFASAKELRKHYKNIHGIIKQNVYSCDQCDKSYKVASSLDIHRATHSNETPFLCDLCGKSFKHASNLRCHKRSHAKDGFKYRYLCDLCPKSFPSKFHLSEHKNVHLDITPYSCTECGKKFSRRIQLRQHQTTHATENKFECPQCGIRFNRRGNMTQHLKRHFQEKKFVCKVCKMSFQTLSEVVQHRRNHTVQEVEAQTKDNNCPQCQLSFFSYEELEEHKKTHSAQKFECTICSKQLSNRRTLEYHIRSFHTCERPYQCQFCPEMFLSRESQTVHERLHTGEKPFTCSVCNMSFRCASNLAQHTNIHTDERPWPCNQCSKRFKRKGILLVHMRTHTGEKPYCCDICGRRFTQKNDMIKHQQTHNPQKLTFTCPDCNVAFPTRRELNKHRQTHIATPEQAEASGVPPQSDAVVITTDNITQFPITITENGHSIIVHRLEDLDHTQILDVDPNQQGPHILHLTEPLLHTIVGDPSVILQATNNPQVIQFEEGTVLFQSNDPHLMMQ